LPLEGGNGVQTQPRSMGEPALRPVKEPSCGSALERVRPKLAAAFGSRIGFSILASLTERSVSARVFQSVTAATFPLAPQGQAAHPTEKLRPPAGASSLRASASGGALSVRRAARVDQRGRMLIAGCVEMRFCVRYERPDGSAPRRATWSARPPAPAVGSPKHLKAFSPVWKTMIALAASCQFCCLRNVSVLPQSPR
jgi:hypothetical protein